MPGSAMPQLRASPEHLYPLDDDLQNIRQYELIHGLAGLPDAFTFDPSACGASGKEDWDLSISGMSMTGHLPSLKSNSTISNVSRASTDTMTMASMMPPTQPWRSISPSTRASSLDDGPPPAFGHFQSPSLTEISDVTTVKSWCPSPLDKKQDVATADGGMRTNDAVTAGTSGNVCNWAGCGHPSFATHEELVWHVKADHLLVCPALGCIEASFGSARQVHTHLAVAHPELGTSEVKEWTLNSKQKRPSVSSLDQHQDSVKSEKRSQEEQKDVSHSLLPGQAKSEELREQNVSNLRAPTQAKETQRGVDPMTKELLSVATSKRKCQEQLRNVVEKRAKKRAGGKYSQSVHLKSQSVQGIKGRGDANVAVLADFCSSPHSPFTSAPSPTDLVRSRAVSLIESASFPLVYEHMILPFLAEFLPKWTSPKHVVSVVRGKTRESRRICILTETEISRARKMIIARHVKDLLPENHRPNVSFVFSMGEVVRIMTTWARGLSRDQIDDICQTRNPFYYYTPCMGDSIGIPQQGAVAESTATLGPCLNVDGGSYWLSNFHPFLEAYQSLEKVRIEHPAPQDRFDCLQNEHDSLSPTANYALGDLMVTSGLNLHTTRISHDSYWDECGMDQPLVVTDWALITAKSSRANILRRFPSDMQPLRREPLVKFASTIVPGAPVCSSGRTSGFQRGQVCEIPAYISGVANGTGKATREWFVEEPYNADEEAWIRGGIGVSGDSGAAVVDADTNCIIGQVWGRNKYWGPGPRQAFFTPISDVFDDIQEKCGQQTRPQLPQFRDEADTLPVLPSCRQCYDQQTYHDSRRSSRVSMQSMIMGGGDGDHDPAPTETEAVSELATPKDFSRSTGLEEIGSAFNNVFSPSQLGAASTPGALDPRSPYAPMEILHDEQPVPPTHVPGRKRSGQLPMFPPHVTKRSRVGD